MSLKEEHEALLIAQGEGHLIPGHASAASAPAASPAPRKMGIGQKVVVATLLTVVLVPPLAGFYSYFSGIPLHLLASSKEAEKAQAQDTSAFPSVSLVRGQVHTLQVPEEVCAALGIRKGGQKADAVAVAWLPKTMRPLVLPGSTAFDPTRLARIRARFAPARVVSIAQAWDYSRKTGQTEYRELRPGDPVSKGQILGEFYSVDVGSKKNDLLQALVQLELDQAILDRVEKNRVAIPEVMYLTYVRSVQGDRTEIDRALNNLKLWDIPQEELDALHAEARKISADKDAWLKTPEGRWVNRVKHGTGDKEDTAKEKETENPWGRVRLRAPIDGIIVERNVHKDEMIVDNTVNLFQVADVSRLLVIASCQEDSLPSLEALGSGERQWSVRTVGAGSATGLAGTIDEIGYMIDPNQHTAVIKGYVENPGNRIRAGQYVSATVKIPPPDGVVEIPTDALVDDGMQSLVFVQPVANVHRFTMRRVQVTHHFDRSVFVRETPVPKEEQLTTKEAEEGLLPKEPLRAGELVLLAGAVELKAKLQDLESRPEKMDDAKPVKDQPQLARDPQSRPETKAADRVAKDKAGSVLHPVPRPKNEPNAVKG
jgi:cobalt-zinc-cadmium efflux system membrane fusion protein